MNSQTLEKDEPNFNDLKPNILNSCPYLSLK